MTRGAKTATVDLYPQAAEMARAKAQHYGAPGSLELPENRSYGWPAVATTPNSYRGGVTAGPEHCPGQLRTAYVRLTVGAVVSHGWTQTPGKPSWVPIGVACDGCRVLWPAPAGEAKS